MGGHVYFNSKGVCVLCCLSQKSSERGLPPRLHLQPPDGHEAGREGREGCGAGASLLKTAWIQGGAERGLGIPLCCFHKAGPSAHHTTVRVSLSFHSVSVREWNIGAFLTTLWTLGVRVRHGWFHPEQVGEGWLGALNHTLGKCAPPARTRVCPSSNFLQNIPHTKLRIFTIEGNYPASSRQRQHSAICTLFLDVVPPWDLSGPTFGRFFFALSCYTRRAARWQPTHLDWLDKKQHIVSSFPKRRLRADSCHSRLMFTVKLNIRQSIENINQVVRKQCKAS